jgi:hypothetical protein
MPNDLTEITFERGDLYKRVWVTPISRLSKEFGISDVGLAKICRKLNIPRPERGYWAKLEFGKTPKIPRLPTLRAGEPDHYAFRRYAYQNTSAKSSQLTQENLLYDQIINVPEKLDKPHAFVREARTFLKKSTPDDYGMISFGKKGAFIRVSPASVDRAFRILNTLIIEIERSGFGSLACSKRDPEAYFEILGERIEFSLTETASRIDHVLSDEEKKRKTSGSLWSVKRYDYLPNNNLALKIETFSSLAARRKWADSKTMRLEGHIARFINGAIVTAQIIKTERKEREEQKKKFEEAQIAREREEQLRKAEKDRLLNLEKQAEQWKKSELIRGFIQAVEREAKGLSSDDEIRKKIEDWLSWAKKMADQIDPTKRIIPRKNP